MLGGGGVLCSASCVVMLCVLRAGCGRADGKIGARLTPKTTQKDLLRSLDSRENYTKKNESAQSL